MKQSADAKEVLQMLSYIDAHEIPWYDIFEKSGCYTLHTLNEIEIIINNYSFFSKDGDIVDMHELTQEFIRLQMQRDNETEKYYEKILNIFSKILPDYIKNASEKELCDRLIRHALALILNGKQDFESENMLYFATNTISKLYVLGYYQQTIEVSLKILKLNNTSTEKFRVFQTVTFLAQAYHYIGKDEEALCALSKYYSIVSSMEEMDASVKGRLLARYKNVEGLIQKDRGEWEICLNTFLEAKDLFDQMVLDEDNEIKSNLLNNIGITYYHLGQLDNALLNYEKALEYADDSKHLLLRICGNMANTYRASNQLDKAFCCYKKSLKYSIEVGDRRNECVSRNKIGNYYLEQGQYDVAEQDINKSLQLAEELNFKVGVINAICSLGNLAFHRQDYVTAKKYWEQSLKESCVLGYRDGIENSKNFLKYLPTS